MGSFLFGFRSALLAGLGITTLSGCGNIEADTVPDGGMGGAPWGGGAVTAGAATGGDSSGGATTGGGTGGSTAAEAGAGGGISSCQNPKPFLPAGQPTGFVQCHGGWLHRPQVVRCEYKPSDTVVENTTTLPAGCERDADCTEQPFGRCNPGGFFPFPTPPYCSYGCEQDSDCAGSLCRCVDGGGVCESASCKTDADCDSALCVGTRRPNPCGARESYAFACYTAADECLSDSHCPNPGTPLPWVCTINDSTRACAARPACGRPFLVHGVARTADASRAVGWSRATYPSVTHLDPETRRALAQHWTDVALMEHASVAAFARFTLELLALGAPAELLRDTQRALGDEIKHAELCFGIAAAYGGAPVGPSTLALDGSLDARSPLEIVKTAFLEGCIGETLATVEARALAEHAVDPVIRAALERIAEDEARHAELGFRFVRWALESSAPAEREELECALEELLSRELDADVELERASFENDRLALGLPTPGFRAEARRVAWRELIVPCATALLGRAAAHAA